MAKLGFWAARSNPKRDRNCSAKGEARDVTIEVRNEHRQRVLTVTITMQVDRVHPPPLAP
jgi:hypothetical protein